MLRNGVVISEILVDPNGTLNFDTDGNGTAEATDEFIEIHNGSALPIDISGLELWDQGVGRWFTFPDGTILQPGAQAMVVTGVQDNGSLPSGGPNSLFFDAGRGTALINNGGDNVVLYDPGRDEYIQATINGAALSDPPSTYAGFSTTATRVGSGEDFGPDTDGLSQQRVGGSGDVIVSGTPTPGAANVCFAGGTFLATPNGSIAIEDLQVGDLVTTVDHGDQPIIWVYSHHWTARQVGDAPNLAAVHIPAGALGINLPSRDLRVSQQHRILIRGAIAERMFGHSEVLIPAKALLAFPGVVLDFAPDGVTYYHIMFDQHQVVLANGTPSESLYLGAQALDAIPDDALQDICAVLDLTLADLIRAAGKGEPARTFVKGKRASRLIARHVKNNRAISLE